MVPGDTCLKRKDYHIERNTFFNLFGIFDLPIRLAPH